MTDFHTLIDSYQNCACGQAHECAIRDIEIGSGLVSEAGDHAGRGEDRGVF